MITTYGLHPLAYRLTAAFEGGPETGVAERLAIALQTWFRKGARGLPERFLAVRPEGYCRRLLHLDALRRFSVLVMTWAPEQGASLHDHAGGWGVECVLAGQMEEESFRKVGRQQGARLRFESTGFEHRAAGSVSLLRPPLEYHALRNPSPTVSAATVHVYPGELTQCRVFRPLEDGSYHPELRRLTYTE